MKIKVYTSVRMTGRVCAEVRKETDMLARIIENWGFEILSPVLEEKIPYTEDIIQADRTTLERFWARDKEMLREADVVLDFATHNQSDGANKEIAYARYCLWRPVVRVWRLAGAGISRLEDDAVVGSLTEAMMLIQENWGTVEKLKLWRMTMWNRCFENWLKEQIKMNERYGIGNQPLPPGSTVRLEVI